MPVWLRLLPTSVEGRSLKFIETDGIGCPTSSVRTALLPCEEFYAQSSPLVVAGKRLHAARTGTRECRPRASRIASLAAFQASGLVSIAKAASLR